jgi:hypothetical protein
VRAEQSNHAKAYLRKAEEYIESAEDNLELERYTPAAGDSIHAGISAKDAIVTSLVGTTGKGKDHAAAVKELSEVPPHSVVGPVCWNLSQVFQRSVEEHHCVRLSR